MKYRLFLVLVLSAAVRLFAETVADIEVACRDFRLRIGADARVKSLVVAATGEECIDAAQALPLFTVTQDRPFNNEIKLIHPNKRTVYPACRLRREGDTLVAGFPHRQYEAKVSLKTGAGYVAFTLEDFICDRKATYDYLKMDVPPVASFRVLQLPVKNRKNFGDWLNASWDEKAAVGVVGTSPYPDIDHEERVGARILFGEVYAGLKLRGAGAALIAAPGREAFLDAMDALERDFGLPRGVASRRGDAVKESIFHLSRTVTPDQIDEIIAYAKKGGFNLMTFGQYHVTSEIGSWGRFGDYEWRDCFPNREADLKAMLAKIKAAGIHPGLHTLHSHIGLKSRYVTPVADPRLNKTRRFTLAEALPAGTNDLAEVRVFEPTADTVMFEPCRILQFGGELLSYESYTTEPPYKFLGVKRGAHATTATAHPKGEIGGILDISEFGTPMSCYLDQNSDLQDEVAAKIANIYNCGFEYVYLDGSEGVNRPFNFHVGNAQYRLWRLLKPEPLFGEGAAKTHFGWHMLAGANAFDCFPPAVFKEKLREFPFAQAPITAQDMSRVDFGWWSFRAPRTRDGKVLDTGVQADMWEYGVSVATAWNCAMSILMPLDQLKCHPRTDDILETMRRWADIRRRGLFREEWRPLLKNYAQEHHLLELPEGGCDLVPYRMVSDGLRTDFPVRAFVFERDGAAWAVYWHLFGEDRVVLPLEAGNVTLFDAFAVRPAAVEAVDGGVALPAGNRRYLRASNLSCAALAAAFAQGRLARPSNSLKTPETSKLFEKFTDPQSGVVSYLLKPGIESFQQQSLYYSVKSMTDDGRFLVFDVYDGEHECDDPNPGKSKHFAIVDFAHDRILRLPKTGGEKHQIPFLDVKTDTLYYICRDDNTFRKRELAKDPQKEIVMCPLPKELLDIGYVRGWFTHLTMSADRTKAFLETRITEGLKGPTPPHLKGKLKSRYIQGTLDVTNGKWHQWTETPFANHAAINPADDTLAYYGWGNYLADYSKRRKEAKKRGEKFNEPFLSMFFAHPDGTKVNFAPEAIPHATHQTWSEDGRLLYWCSRDAVNEKWGVYTIDPKTMKQNCLAPVRACHAMLTRKMDAIVFDWPHVPLGRGCGWETAFYNCATKKQVFIHSDRPPIADIPNKKYSNIHPDPHPQFVMDGRYVVSTFNCEAPRRMTVSVTPTAQLWEKTR